MTSMSQSRKATDVLLVAIDSAQFGQYHTRFPRAPWATRVLVEQLIDLLPDGTTRDAVLALRDPERGVINRNISPVIRQLTAESLITPNGFHSSAFWTITRTGYEALESVRPSLSDRENSAVQAASQRAMAIIVAWSKTARA